MVNFIWKIVCLVALVSLLCLMLTGKIAFKDIEESTIEIKNTIGNKIVDPIKKRYVSNGNDSDNVDIIEE